MPNLYIVQFDGCHLFLYSWFLEHCLASNMSVEVNSTLFSILSIFYPTVRKTFLKHINLSVNFS